MSESQNGLPPSPVVLALAPAPDAFEMSIDEYCALRSRTDGRVELVTAFFSINQQILPRALKTDFDRAFTAFAARKTI